MDKPYNQLVYENDNLRALLFEWIDFGKKVSLDTHLGPEVLALTQMTIESIGGIEMNPNQNA